MVGKFVGVKSGEVLVEAKNLTKIYGKKENRFVALDGVNLKIAKGESVAIVGKSGSGKSTLMHLLAMLDSPSSGSLSIEGAETTKLKSGDADKLRNSKFGFVFQQFFLNGNDTVLNNVTLPLRIAGVSKKVREKRGMEVLALVGLREKSKNKANDLSGGQKQRVCIGRALVNHPEVIFADEPTGNLDSATGSKIEEILFKLNKEHGITLIIVTHDDDLAKKCGREIQIKDGKVVKLSAAGSKSSKSSKVSKTSKKGGRK
jgi:putative ABC transport system ATP-binding protein